MLARMRDALRPFGRDTRGTAAVEFALVAPIFFALLFSFYDLGAMMLRQATLRAGMDAGARLIRIDGEIKAGRNLPGQLRDDYAELICSYAKMVNNCRTNLILDMRQMAPGDAFPAPDAPCVPTLPDGSPSTTFTSARSQNIVFVRACAKADTLFGSYVNGISSHLEDANGDVLVRAATAFVFE